VNDVVHDDESSDSRRHDGRVQRLREGVAAHDAARVGCRAVVVRQRAVLAAELAAQTALDVAEVGDASGRDGASRVQQAADNDVRAPAADVSIGADDAHVAGEQADRRSLMHKG
jgi:hypothetical protein